MPTANLVGNGRWCRGAGEGDDSGTGRGALNATFQSSAITSNTVPSERSKVSSIAMPLLQTLAHEVHHLRDVWPGRPKTINARGKRGLA
jgi:hypothetical protein